MMSDVVKVALITAIPLIIGQILLIIQSARHERIIVRLEGSLNGRLDEWIKVVRQSSFAEGKLEGKHEKPVQKE